MRHVKRNKSTVTLPLDRHVCPIKIGLQTTGLVYKNQQLSVALLTIYAMCKAADRGMVITDVKLLEKHGGKSGNWVA